jgi:NADH-quinone oxidoreductase subunit G
MQEWITITVDSQTVSVQPGTTVLDAARSLGIEIPTLCYYAKLSRLGACRLCLVEISRMRGLQTACTTPVRPEMDVHTNTPEILEARRGIIEFLLTNHPLDCPVCDKGGECELQNLAYEHGPGESRYIEEKRHKKKAVLVGPTVLLDEERCVLCRRCVRYLQEWADDPLLNYMGRGSGTHVGTFTGRPLVGKFVGNVVDLCPVGALTSRTSRFAARAWEFEEVPSVCVQCGVGCNVTLGTKTDVLRRVTARLNPAVNDEWLCDRGRFAIDFVHGDNRLTTPMIRRESGELEPADWDEALNVVGAKLLALAQEHGGDSLGALGSAVATNEANYLLQRFMRAGFGTNNIDYLGRLPEEAMPLDMGRLSQADVIVLCDLDLAEEAPIVDLLLRHETMLRDVKFVGIGAKRPSLGKQAGQWLSCFPEDQVAVLNGLANLLLETEKGKKITNAAHLTEWVSASTPEEVGKLTGVLAASVRSVADTLAESEHPLILYGPSVWKLPEVVKGLDNLALLTRAGTPACVAGGCNSRGALDVGVAPGLLPGRQPMSKAPVRDRLGKAWGSKLSTKPGLDAEAMKSALRDGKLKALYVMHANPVAEAPGWAKALKSADAFVVVQDMFLTETTQFADVVLPCASFAEGDGTLTSLSGRVQRLRQSVPLHDGARTDDQILSDLAVEMGSDFGYDGPEDVMREMARVAPLYEGTSYDLLSNEGHLLDYGNGDLRVTQAEYSAPRANAEYPLMLVTGRLLFDNDYLLRQTPAFDEMVPEPYLVINPDDAAKLEIKEGHRVKVTSRVGQVRVVARFSQDILVGCVFLPMRVGDTLATTVLQDEVPVTRVRVTR